MKTAKTIKLFLSFSGLVLMILYLGSCATSSVGVQVLIPAEINIPQHIKKVAVINHSLPSKENQKWNILEGILTGERLFGDREGSENCLLGLVNQLNTGPRFTASLITNMDIRGTGTREIPPPIDWSTVEAVCKSIQADALVALETFDSDFKIDQYSRNTTKKVENQDVTVTEFFADMRVNVNATWRIYDNVNKRIVDQKAYLDYKTFSGKGPDPDKALKSLPDKRNAINQAAMYSGSMFGFRISPSWRYETRSYYIRKGGEFKIAQRYVRLNDWDQAIGVWTNMTTSPEKKVGGRACYNLGVAYEMKGEFETAIEWMKKAYYNYNVKPALQYIGILNRRIEDRKRLDQQLGN